MVTLTKDQGSYRAAGATKSQAFAFLPSKKEILLRKFLSPSQNRHHSGTLVSIFVFLKGGLVIRIKKYRFNGHYIIL